VPADELASVLGITSVAKLRHPPTLALTDETLA
jgi:hypothetical protein